MRIDGRWAGYRQYRYGETAPVTLGGHGDRAKGRIVHGARRESVLERLMELLDQAHASRFGNEGAAVAGLRSAFCLDGNGWHASHREAQALVAEGLRRLGVSRPSWEEGQPGYPLGTEYCHWCCCRIDEQDMMGGRRFCSSECAKLGLEHMARKNSRYYGVALQSAIVLLRREDAEKRQCARCCREFVPRIPSARFCCNKCRLEAQFGRELLKEVTCICGAVFQPASKTVRFCSVSCARRAAVRAKIQAMSSMLIGCWECGQQFHPRSEAQRFCTEPCRKRNAGRMHRRQSKRLLPTLRCSWCGTGYQPAISPRKGQATFCSNACGVYAGRLARGSRPRKLTERVFDHFITLPADEAHMRRLTPQKLDWLFMEAGLTITAESRLPRHPIDDLFDRVETATMHAG